MLIQNIWNEDVATIGYYSVPPKDMSITFTVSGFAYDNESAAAETVEPSSEAAPSSDAAAPAEAPAETKSGVSPVVIVVIVVVVVAVIAVAVVLGKKKKSSK